MFGKADLMKIKNDIEDSKGKKIMITAKKGRKKVIVRTGIVEGTYPSVFTVKLDKVNDFFPAERCVSYSYADVLTRNIEMAFCGENGEKTSNVSSLVEQIDQKVENVG